MRITPQDIRQQQFTVRTFRGFDPQEVDAFLEDVADDYETKLKEWNKDKAFKNEVEAQELLAKARELLQQGKNAEAQAVYKRIASKYKGTTAADAAEKALAQF